MQDEKWNKRTNFLNTLHSATEVGLGARQFRIGMHLHGHIQAHFRTVQNKISAAAFMYAISTSGADNKKFKRKTPARMCVSY